MCLDLGMRLDLGIGLDLGIWLDWALMLVDVPAGLWGCALAPAGWRWITGRGVRRGVRLGNAPSTRARGGTCCRAF